MAKRISKNYFNFLQWVVRAFLLPMGGITLAAGKLTYICIRDNLPEVLPYSIGMTLLGLFGVFTAIYFGFNIDFERKPDQARYKFQWTVKSMINFILTVSTALTLWIYFKHNDLWSDYFIATFAAFLGVFFAFNFDVIIHNLRRQERRDKWLRDIYKELKRNSTKLVGKGYVLKTDIWNSGISTGLIQLLDSNDLEKLSSLYHSIDINFYEAKICRLAGEDFSSLPAGTPERLAAKRRWERLSSALINRESEIKKMIEDILKEDFWQKFGMKKDEL